ncbi:MAG: PAS domain-containing sensor histidine kinase [Cytophagales bacterium]|nr:PAS domain-containing sensor histidine kinase [Cytophagales bacterium]
MSIENLFDLPESTGSIKYNGSDISIKWLNGYRSQQTMYQSRYALLNEKVLVISSSGNPQPYDIKKATAILEKIHCQNKLSNIDVVWDVRDIIENPSLKVRKAINLSNNQLSEFWNRRFLVLPARYQTFVRTYKFVYKRQSEHIFIVRSIKSAIDTILYDKSEDLEFEAEERFDDAKREKLLRMSKEELVNLIEQNTRSREESTKTILEAIGQITWKGRFDKLENGLYEDDPDFELINAFSLLQQDVVEIIKEYKDLNRNLELKVAERIVDFIDKESNLRAILDNSDRVTWLMNKRFELIDFNLAFLNEIKKRYKHTPLINQNVLEILAGKEKDIWRDRFETVLQGKPRIYLDQDNFDGEERVLEIKMFPIKEIGKIKGVSVFIEDITEIKDSQFKLIEKNRDLEKVNSELDSFVYRVSHDLRAPLTSILGLISLMKIETSQEKVSEYIALQENSINKLDLFIKEIINLSRNSRLGITVSQIDFEVLIDEIFESQNFSKIDKKVEQIVNIDEGISFFTDRQRLSIILNNLVSNALKYVNVHEESSYVKIDVRLQNMDCVIEISDNGIGISEVYLPKIFEMFFRATQEFSGSGLGLYIVKETVQKLRGTISVKSKTRLGTTFKVILPNLKDRFDAAPKLED